MTNTSLGPGLNPIIWRNSPSREVDEAWDSLYTNSLLLITEDDLKRMGKSPEEYAHIPTSFGYGKRQYYAKFEHIHKIHCLNLIRKWVHADYYFPNGKPMHKGMVHVDHCIHSLLEDYLCHVNYGVYTYQWIDVEALPEPDFQVTRQCRDYGKLLEFAKSNRVDWDKRVVYYPKPEDAKVFEQDPIVKKLDEVWEKEHPDKITREGEKDLFKSRYQEAMDEWRRTGKIPVVESENMHP
ncbi:tat pathway signal sequence protein [Stemphylium lycopersici]|uniref:Tat pathway signal sequence protein n=1 Tax=Stemphylium lycopersici TaxID=183478 RepID=A0A364MV20_STELY|nr:tat pathway signal sequence protein [Stemphylium lycopersici]RAR01759.1 tat pathway signal sequence protein [Stemphylium lycopersici]RAR04418.1 tat pathway signal sequence protein [Stemphylium lycopersici]